MTWTSIRIIGIASPRHRDDPPLRATSSPARRRSCLGTRERPRGKGSRRFVSSLRRETSKKRKAIRTFIIFLSLKHTYIIYIIHIYIYHMDILITLLYIYVYLMSCRHGLGQGAASKISVGAALGAWTVASSSSMSSSQGSAQQTEK